MRLSAVVPALDEADGIAAHLSALAPLRANGAEEIVVKKHQVEESQTVEADLRRERAEVREVGDVRRVDGMRADEVGGTDPLRGGRDLDGDGVR